MFPKNARQHRHCEIVMFVNSCAPHEKRFWDHKNSQTFTDSLLVAKTSKMVCRIPGSNDKFLTLLLHEIQIAFYVDVAGPNKMTSDASLLNDILEDCAWYFVLNHKLCNLRRQILHHFFFAMKPSLKPFKTFGAIGHSYYAFMRLKNFCRSCPFLNVMFHAIFLHQ